MRITAKHQIVRISVVAAVAVFTSVACVNNSDYKTSDNNAAAPDSIVGGTNKSTTKDVAVQDSNAIPNGTNGAVATNKTAEPVPAHTTPKNEMTKSTLKRRSSVTATLPVAKAGTASTAQFPGGQKALDNYVNDHINYPQQAIDNDVAGVVRVTFIVNEKGKVTKAKLVGNQRLGDGLDEEALRVVNAMPAWKPATMHGKKVKTQLELPISFQVES